MTGPKISSRVTRMFYVTSASTVGWINNLFAYLPSSGEGVPHVLGSGSRSSESCSALGLGTGKPFKGSVEVLLIVDGYRTERGLLAGR